jgi:hypothetical protein
MGKKMQIDFQDTTNRCYQGMGRSFSGTPTDCTQGRKDRSSGFSNHVTSEDTHGGQKYPKDNRMQRDQPNNSTPKEPHEGRGTISQKCVYRKKYWKNQSR